MRCFLVVPDRARLSRLSRGRRRPCSCRVLAGRAVIVFSAKKNVPTYLLVRINTHQSVSSDEAAIPVVVIHMPRYILILYDECSAPGNTVFFRSQFFLFFFHFFHLHFLLSAG